LSSQPFFTIGVPTYNRHKLLRKTLESILAQSFSDFEVIVGNDYTSEVLTGETLGITDPRISFVNHPSNLREVGNMNALLAAARGRYFTWLFDDDLFEPDFLLTAHTTLYETNFPPALYTSYRVIDEADVTLDPAPATGKCALLNGTEFLETYFAGQLKLVSTCGMFDTVALTSTVGGVEELCDSAIGLYCEYLFLIRCGAFDRIAYVDTPLVVFRAHSGSWGESNTELEKYIEAGGNLLRRCGEALRQNICTTNSTSHLIGLCKIHLVSFATKLVLHEISRGNTGLCATYRTIKRFSSEASAIRKACINEAKSDNWHIHDTVSFLKIQIHCYRLILGKFRVHH
jgi:glycosyltransferase involved in cell wall biosynthesis